MNRLCSLLFLVVLLAAAPCDARSPAGTSPIDVQFKSVTLSEALDRIARASGCEIRLSGTYVPDAVFSLNVRQATLDAVLNRILKDMDYTIIRDGDRRLISIAGPAAKSGSLGSVRLPQGGTPDPVKQDSALPVVTARLEQYEIPPILPESAPQYPASQYNIRDTDGLVEIVPDMKQYEDREPANYQSATRPDGTAELVPDMRDGDWSGYTQNMVVLDGHGPDPVVEFIKAETPQQIDPARLQTNSDGIVELLPPGIN